MIRDPIDGISSRIAPSGRPQQSRPRVGFGDKRLLFVTFSAYISCRLMYPSLCGASGAAWKHRDPGISRQACRKKERILSKNSKDVMDRAEASFRKEERAREGAKAMRDYEAEGRAVHEKTARLKALRLAKEAAEKEAEPKKGSRQTKATLSR
jgi:hypothetical protein